MSNPISERLIWTILVLVGLSVVPECSSASSGLWWEGSAGEFVTARHILGMEATTDGIQVIGHEEVIGPIHVPSAGVLRLGLGGDLFILSYMGRSRGS